MTAMHSDDAILRASSRFRHLEGEHRQYADALRRIVDALERELGRDTPDLPHMAHDVAEALRGHSPILAQRMRIVAERLHRKQR